MFGKITGFFRKMPDWLKVILLLAVAGAILPAGFLTWAWCHDAKYERIAREVIDPMAAEYIQQTYPDRDFVAEDAGYAFKDNCFFVRVYSPSSPDTYFRLSYDYKTCEFLGDSYDTWVLSGRNTRERVEAEYQTRVEECLGSMDGLSRLWIRFTEYSDHEAHGLYFSPQGLDMSTLIVDHPYDAAAMGWGYGYVEVTFLEDAENITPERLHERILEIDDLMTRSGVGYYVLEITLANGEYPVNTMEFTISKIRRADIGTEALQERIRESWNKQKAQWENSE